MAVKEYKKCEMRFSKNIRSNRTTNFDLYDGDKRIGRLTLNMDFAMVENKGIGESGRVTNPSPDQLLQRLTLDTPRTSHDRYVKFKK